MNKVSRFEVDDLLRKGYRAYNIKVNDRDKEYFSNLLYNRFFLENFFIGKALFVKDRKDEGIERV